MRGILITTILIAAQGMSAQQRFVDQQFTEFYDWFHQQSQVEALYQDRTTLYTFTDQVTVRQGPCLTSATVTKLPAGYSVQNIAHPNSYYLPEDEIDGYNDIWFHVRGKGPDGRAFNGYIWGAQLAKGWRWQDLDGDGQAEFVMLGISSQPRTKPQDIKAEIRILKNGRLTVQQQVPGLCVFESCAASPLLRIFQTAQGFTMIEASTATFGCWAGIEKAFFCWNGNQLQRVYHAEYTTGHEFFNEPFVVTTAAGSAQLCRYSHEGKDHAPVWKCEPITTNGRAAIAMGNDPRAQGK
jgi:hypothetical protein